MRSFRQSLCITLVAIFVSLLLLNNLAQAKTELEQMKERLNNQLGAMAARDKQTLFRIIESYYVSSRHSVDWLHIKDNLNISVPSDIMEDLEPIADTDTDKSGRHHLQINQMMLFRFYDQSQSAARYVMKEEFSLSLHRAGQSNTTKLLGLAISWTANAWAIAHEIAHNIYLDPQTPAESFDKLRQRELRADKKAFELMNNAGYSMTLLYRYMHYMDSVEQVKKRAGRLRDDSQRTHPYWSERLQALNLFLTSNLPPASRMAVYSTLTYSYKTKDITQELFILPSYDYEHLGYLAIVGGGVAPVGVERLPNGNVRIYVRDVNVVYEFHMRDAVNYITTMKKLQPDGKELIMEAWRDSFEGAAVYDQTNQIRNAMQFDNLSLLYVEIDKMKLSTINRQQAKTYVYQRTARNHDHMLDYYSGRISVQDMQAEMTKTASYYDNKLGSILTTEQINRLSQVLIKKISDLILKKL